MLRQLKKVESVVLRGVKRKSCSQALLSQAARTSRQSPVAKVRTRRTQCTNTSAWAQFRKTNWTADIRPGTPAASAEQTRITGVWKAMTVAEQNFWMVPAAAEHLSFDRAFGAAVGNYEEGLRGCWALRRCRRAKLLKLADKLKSHPLWRAGSAMSCAGCGLQEKHLDIVSIGQEINDVVRRAFQYNNRIVETKAPGRHQGQVCSQVHGGLCTHDRYGARAKACVKNLHTSLQARKLGKKDLPLFVACSVTGLTVAMLLVFIFGRGEFMTTVGLDFKDPWWELTARESAHGETVVCKSMHVEMHRLLAKAGEGIDGVRVRVAKIVDAGECSHFFFSTDDIDSFTISHVLCPHQKRRRMRLLYHLGCRRLLKW